MRLTRLESWPSRVVHCSSYLALPCTMLPTVSMAYVFELMKAGPPEEALALSLDIVFSSLEGRKELQEITGS